MKGKKHRPEQIIKKLREADTMLAADKPIGQVCQALEVSEQTYHRWRAQYGGMKHNLWTKNQGQVNSAGDNMALIDAVALGAA